MKKMFTLFVLAVFCFVKGWGQAPVNDVCSGAIELTCGSSYSGTNANATNEGLLPDCGGTNGAYGNSVWFTYTAAANGKATFSTVGGASWDTYLRVYSGSCSALVCAGSNDDYESSLQSLVTINVARGTTYYILLTPWNAAKAGDYTISATCDYMNDDCSTAKPIACGQTVTGDNTNATGGVFPVPSCGDDRHGFEREVWYKYIAQTTDSVTFSTVGGASWDTYLRVFSGTCEALICNGRNDDYGGAQSQIKVAVTAGQTYYVMLAGYGDADYGAYSLTATCCTPPTVTGISGGGTYCTNSSTPDLTITTTGDITNYEWYYNTTNSTAGGTLVGIYPTQPIFANLVGTKYYYAVVSNSCGSDTSATEMVTINAAPTSAMLTPQQTEICYGSQIQVSATATGGVKPYTYSFVDAGSGTGSPFAPAKTKNEPAGMYYVIAKGANGCTINSLPVTITQPASPIAITAKITDGICNGNGKIRVSATGGYGDFVYTINTDSAVRKTTPCLFDNLPQGYYIITAIDAHGCSKSRVIEVGSTTKIPGVTGFSGPSQVAATSTTVYTVDSAYNVSYNWSVPSDAVVVLGQGTATASIKWGYKSGKIKITPSSSCGTGTAKQYSITVTHSNSFESNVIANTIVKPGDGISVYPNPTRDMAILQFTGTGEAKYMIDVTDMRGREILHKEGAAVRGTNQVKLDLKNVANGVYLIRVSDGKTIQTIKLIKGN